jgi:endonuclease YncB( thermonuclease family)
MLACIAILFSMTAGPSWAADAIIKDGDTLRLGSTLFRLEGIDAPELDQVCLDEKGSEWACGIEARDQLIRMIGNRAVNCHDNGPDPAYPENRLGICWVGDEDLSLNQRLVREGWALNFEPYAKRRFKADQDEAQDNRRGLWKGCFAAPWDLRNWRKSAAKLLGPACGNVAIARNRLFPDQLDMPPGCSIKGKIAVRAHITGHRGIYHLESCRSYRTTKNPNRWFCSEDEAKAAGFRKSYRC